MQLYELKVIFAHTFMQSHLGNYNEVSAELNEARDTEEGKQRECLRG